MKSDPTLVLHRGRILEGALKAQRITRDEVVAALRSHGVADVAQVAAVILETDGTLAVIQNVSQVAAEPTLASVRMP